MANKINSPVVNNGLPIPVGFNTPSNRLVVDVLVRSDVTVCSVGLYEYHGLYWFSFYHVPLLKDMNSRGFFSLRNCVSALKATVNAIGFTIQDPYALKSFVNAFEHSIKTQSGVA